jgi:hypothetical protein
MQEKLAGAKQVKKRKKLVEKMQKNHARGKTPKKFTKKEIKIIINLYQQGLTSSDIGKIFKRQDSTICQLLKRLGIKRRSLSKAHLKKSKYIGKKFGFLTVMANVQRIINNKKRTFLKVRCICGKRKLIYSSSLKNGHTKSCGNHHLNRKNRVSLVNLIFTHSWNDFVQGCKKRNIKTTLTKKDVFKLIFDPCFYCGRKNVNIRTIKHKYSTRIIRRNGIDRINNKLGYHKNNVVSCCGDCNEMKMARTKKEFINLIKLIYKNTLNK